MEIFANLKLWLVECASIRRERVEVLLDRRVDISFVKKIIEEALSRLLSLFLSGLFFPCRAVSPPPPPSGRPTKVSEVSRNFSSLGWRWRRVFSYFQLAAAADGVQHFVSEKELLVLATS
jgi:hypothetical protein